MSCRVTKRTMKSFYDQNIDRYDEAREEAFNDEFRDFLDDLDMSNGAIIAEWEIQGFMDNFDFPCEAVWIANEYESAIDDCGDAEYERRRDESV